MSGDTAEHATTPDPHPESAPRPETLDGEVVSLARPVQACDGCAHDAIRLGWEPGR